MSTLFVVNIGLHGDEYDASHSLWSSLRPLLELNFPNSSFLLLPQLSDWCVHYRFRYDFELVDLNRIFVPHNFEFYYPGLNLFELSPLSCVPLSLLTDIDNYISSLHLNSFPAIESCLSFIHDYLLPLPDFFSMTQSSHPGLPGFNYSTNASSYFSRCNSFIDTIIHWFYFVDASRLVFLDLHSGVGTPSQLSIGEIFHPNLFTTSPMKRHGSYLSYFYHALTTLLPISPLCLSLEIGTFGCYQAMCSVFQELQSRRGFCSPPAAFKPTALWSSQVSLRLDSDFSTHVLPLITEAFT